MTGNLTQEERTHYQTRRRHIAVVTAAIAAGVIAVPSTASAAYIGTANATTATLTGDDASDALTSGEAGGLLTQSATGFNSPTDFDSAVAGDQHILTGGGGRDVVDGLAGHDRLVLRDGVEDLGRGGTDTAVADRVGVDALDSVETADRTAASRVTITPSRVDVRFRGSRGSVRIGLRCPTVEASGCRGTLTLVGSVRSCGRRLNAVLGTARYSLKAGQRRTITVRAPEQPAFDRRWADAAGQRPDRHPRIREERGSGHEADHPAHIAPLIRESESGRSPLQVAGRSAPARQHAGETRNVDVRP